MQHGFTIKTERASEHDRPDAAAALTDDHRQGAAERFVFLAESGAATDLIRR